MDSYRFTFATTPFSPVIPLCPSSTQFLCELIAVFVLVSIANTWLLVPTLVMSVVCFGLRHVYINTARCVKRVEALSKYTHAHRTHITREMIRI